MLARIAQHQAGDQTEADYGIPKGLTLRDEIARYFRIGQALFKELMVSETPSTAATVNFVEQLLRNVFGFAEVHRAGTRTAGDRQFTITLEGLGGRVPVVVVPPADDLDHPSLQLATDGRRRSAASALQDWLNAGQGCSLGPVHEWRAAALNTRQCQPHATGLRRGRFASHLRGRSVRGFRGAVAPGACEPLRFGRRAAHRLGTRTLA